MSFRAVTDLSLPFHSLKTSNMGFGENFHGIPILYILFYTAFLSVVNCINCQHIRRELKSWLPIKQTSFLQSSVHILERGQPFHDDRMTICYNGADSSKKSCCTHTAESDYLRHGDRLIRKLISFHNFQRTLRNQRVHFEREEKQFKKGVGSYLVHSLAAQFKLSKSSLQGIVDNFFSHLLSNMTRPREETIVDDFILEVSPLIYYHYIKNGDQGLYVMSKHQCLVNSFKSRRKSSFAPQKDGNLIMMLKKTKRANQRLKNSIRLLLSVLEKLENVRYPVQCLKAMARNHLCPTCFGTANISSVCLKTCQNVFHGCHIHWADLEPSWDRFVNGASQLSDYMVTRWSIVKALRNIIDFAISTLLKNVYTELKLLDSSLLKDCFVEGFDIKPVKRQVTTTNKKTPKFPGLMDNLLKSFSKLMKSKVNFFTKLVRKPCQKLPQFSCWNGTHFSRTGYSRHVPEFHLSNQKKNLEVSGPSADQMHVVNQLKRELDRHYSEIDAHELVQEVRKDTPDLLPTRRQSRRRGNGHRRNRLYPKEGSGSSLPEGSGVGSKKNTDDDEDKIGSGSGQSESSFPEWPVTPRVTIVKRPLSTMKVPKPNEPQTTSAAVIIYENPSGKDGNIKTVHPPATPKSVTAIKNAASISVPVISWSSLTISVLMIISS